MELHSLVLVLGTLLVSVHSYPSTVPPTASVCRNMTPGHGPRPLSSSPGCKVRSSTDSVSNGGQVEVTIDAVDPSKPFKGYYLQARDAQNNPIGTFTPTSEAKTHSCGGIKNNAAHHTSGSGKKTVSVFWKAPAKFDGVVTFTATCVQDFDNFWTLVKSTPVKIQPSRNRLNKSPKEKSRRSKINDTFIRNHRQTVAASDNFATNSTERNDADKSSRILNHPKKYVNDHQPSVNLYLPNEDDEEEVEVGQEKLFAATSNYDDQTTNSVDSSPPPNSSNNNNNNNNNGRRRNNRGRNRNNNNNNRNNNNNGFYYEHSVSFPDSPGARLGGSVSGGQFQFPTNNFNGGIGSGVFAGAGASASASASASSSSSIISNSGILNPSSFNFRSDPTFQMFNQQLHLPNMNPNLPRSSSSFIIGGGFPGSPRVPSPYPNYYQFSTNLDGPNSSGNFRGNRNGNRPNSIRDQISKNEDSSNPTSNSNSNRRPGRNYFNSNVQLSSVNNNFYNDDNKSGLISPPRIETGFRPNFFQIPPPSSPVISEEIIYGRLNNFRRGNRRNSRFFPDGNGNRNRNGNRGFGESINVASAIPPEFQRGGPQHHHHRHHSEFNLPSYGYLIFNPARGPPYYIIPQAREEEKAREILLNNDESKTNNRIDSNHFRNDKFDKDLNFRQTRTQIIHTTEKNSRIF